MLHIIREAIPKRGSFPFGTCALRLPDDN